MTDLRQAERFRLQGSLQGNVLAPDFQFTISLNMYWRVWLDQTAARVAPIASFRG
jgi:hypothetical protein